MFRNFVIIITLAAILFSAALSSAAVSPFEGYTLYSPNLSNNTYLVNMGGSIAHSWYNSKRGGYSVYLLENGHIVRPASPNMTYLNGGGSAGLVQELDISGSLVWEFEYNTTQHLTHHDIEPIPNGNVLAIAWEVKTAAQAVQAGRNTALVMWPDHVIEIQPNGSGGGSIVWEWHVWDHLVQDYDPAKDNYGVVGDHPELLDINMPLGGIGGPGSADWLHLNGIDYNEEFDQIILSSHFTDEFYIIDHSTTIEEAAGHSGGSSGMGGDILYRWGSPENYDRTGAEYFDVIHCSVWIAEGYPGEGNILTFNNGEGTHISEIVELTPPVDAAGHYSIEPNSAFAPENPTWVYSAGTGFYSNHLGSCQRLPNGNTLICESTSGDMFEADSMSNVVWNYNTSYEIARCLRYGLNYPGIEAIFPNAVKGKADLLPEMEMTVYPNPFNQRLTLEFTLQEAGEVSVIVYDSMGREIAALGLGHWASGKHSVVWDADGVGSGVYFIRLVAIGRWPVAKKVVLLK